MQFELILRHSHKLKINYSVKAVEEEEFPVK